MTHIASAALLALGFGIGWAIATLFGAVIETRNNTRVTNWYLDRIIERDDV